MAGDIIEGAVVCTTGHIWPIENGVMVFTREDAPSDPWSRTHGEYDAYRRDQERVIAESASQVAPLIGSLQVSPPDTILDVCTGQGALLFNILHTFDQSVELVSLDMSLTIQSYNRRYLLERYGERRVSFISCDASIMPFRDAVFPHVVSLAMGNMLEKLPAGIREVARVLRGPGDFVFSHAFVREDSEGWRAFSGYLQGIGQKDLGFLGLEQDFVRLMSSIGFREYGIEVTGQVVGDPDRDVEAGVFPYPNEPMTEVLVRAVQ